MSDEAKRRAELSAQFSALSAALSANRAASLTARHRLDALHSAGKHINSLAERLEQSKAISNEDKRMAVSSLAMHVDVYSPFGAAEELNRLDPPRARLRYISSSAGRMQSFGTPERDRLRQAVLAAATEYAIRATAASGTLDWLYQLAQELFPHALPVLKELARNNESRDIEATQLPESIRLFLALPMPGILPCVRNLPIVPHSLTRVLPRQGWEGQDDNDDVDDASEASSDLDALDTEEVDLLNWEAISQQVHPILTAQACRTQWLMTDRPPLIPNLVPHTESYPNSQPHTTTQIDPPVGRRGAPREVCPQLSTWRSRWVTRSPCADPWSKSEQERLLAVLKMGPLPQGMQAWTDISRDCYPEGDRCAAEVFSQFMRLTTPNPLSSHQHQKVSPAAPLKEERATNGSLAENFAPWLPSRAFDPNSPTKDPQPARVPELVARYGPRWGFFHEILTAAAETTPEGLDSEEGRRRATEARMPHSLSYSYYSNPTPWTVEEDRVLRDMVALYAPTQNEIMNTREEAPSGASGSGRSYDANSSPASNQAQMLASDDSKSGVEALPWLLVRRALPGKTLRQCRHRWLQLSSGSAAATMRNTASPRVAGDTLSSRGQKTRGRPRGRPASRPSGRPRGRPRLRR